MNQIFKYFGKGLSYLKYRGIGDNYCWNYRPSKFLLHFTEYRLDELNNKHTKTASNSTIQFFESHSRKKYLVKFFLKFFSPPTTKWRPCKIFAKVNGNHLLMANIFKLRKVIYWKCIIWEKCDLATRNSICEKAWLTINGLPKMLIF